MKELEYMKCKMKYFPSDIINKYNLNNIVHNNCIYIKMKRGMYGLKQAAILAYQPLSKLLYQANYRPITGSIGMWNHMNKSITFNLCVDNFGVKYYDKKDVKELMSIIKQKYDIKLDWSRKHFLGNELEWNYEQGWVWLCMPDYVIKALRRLNYTPSKNPKYSSYKSPKFKPLKKGERQIPITTDDSPFLDPKGTRWVQSAIGSCLYNARALDNTILATLNQLGTQ